MNYGILAIVATLMAYVVVYRLRFKLDKAALIILVTQLIVMTARVF